MYSAPPELRTEIPGPRSVELLARLERTECPEVTCLSPLPVVAERASGANLFDVDGNRLVDLVGGFGAAALGYAHPEIVETTRLQAATLPHTLGDVFPARVKIELLERLSERLSRGGIELGGGILSSSGSDAVESALKTALVATGRAGVIAFEGAYHGLGIGALDLAHRALFRDPFRARLAEQTWFAPFGDAAAVRALTREHTVGAIFVEPIQGRGGIRPAPPGFLAELRQIADTCGALLVFDEIYTGLGRCGDWLACDHDGVVPDVVVLGKALGAGLPISACLGRREIMQRWPRSDGEAIHTSTHLGSPIGCAVALRVLDVIERDALVERSRAIGDEMRDRAQAALAASPHVAGVRGRGLMIGIELHDPARARAVVGAALARGWIVLPEGERGNVLGLTPPLTIGRDLLAAAIDCIAALIEAPLDR